MYRGRGGLGEDMMAWLAFKEKFQETSRAQGHSRGERESQAQAEAQGGMTWSLYLGLSKA